MTAEDHGSISTYMNYKCRCDPCHKAATAYKRERRDSAAYHRIMTDLREELGGKCRRCGTDEDLVFDHIDPATKVAQISNLVQSGNMIRVRAELSKCQLLCRACNTSKGPQRKEYL